MNLTAIIEIPKGSISKYEHDIINNRLVLDRVLPLAFPCPFSYGYIPSAPLSGDGDPLDIFIINAEPLVPLSEVKFRVWGVMVCEDNGVEDNKVIAGIDGDTYIDYEYFKKIRLYLENYKTGFIIKEYKVFNDEILFRNFVEKK